MIRSLRIFIVLIAVFNSLYPLSAQETTFHTNGPDDYREGIHAFTHVILYKDYKTKIDNATLVIKDGKVLEAGTVVAIPAGATMHDLKGRFIYPSFIDIYADYGMPVVAKARQENPQYETNIKGAYNWNQAIKSDFEAYKNFQTNNERADELRKQGFGAVLTHRKDGIARGTGAVVTLATDKENKVVIKGNACAHYSFNKGSSTQQYPESLMGAIALLRQTYLDAQWYKGLTDKKEYNITLEAWNNDLALPQIFEAGGWQNALRADKVGDEFGAQYIIKGDGTEYRRIREIKETKARFILPVSYPKAYDVEDPYRALWIDLDDMKHWELAPTNAAALNKAGVEFALTTSDLEKKEDFLKSLRVTVRYGLKEEEALKALTYNPAQFLNMQNEIGSLDKGKLANFIVTSKPLFDDKCVINENWIQGKKYEINKPESKDIRGVYKLTIVSAKTTADSFNLSVIGDIITPRAQLTTMNGYKVKLEVNNRDTLVKNDSTKTASTAGFVNDSSKADGKLTYKDNDITLSFDPHKSATPGKVTLTGLIDQNNKSWQGKGQFANGDWFNWYANFVKEISDTSKLAKRDSIDLNHLSKVSYPFNAYGNEELPQAESIIIKNATVWTNEQEGILKSADVVIKNGKIAAVGSNLNCAECKTIDGKNKNVTSGIIDEHSHIAISGGVNEGTESSSAEVRIGDVITSEDINIYRQLSGGVTASQLLHGSANPIGGQSGLVKLRWGYAPEKMKIDGADGFIKFALGENVKQSNWGDKFSIRYPQSRMGVEQTYVDDFTRAKEYEKAIREGKKVRRDLMLETLVEILNKKRFITCHSYVQSEINMLMHVADSFGFRVNTFTHILEGYKVADKIKAHGANASTFADWWAYKYEVIDAIPYNACIMTKVGINTAINSDDAEMARRLNQEAAKSVKYGGMAEDEAWKMVTLNPAKCLHLDSHMGSLEVGKDADLVIWSDNPLSIYAIVEKTYIDGICFYDKDKDTIKREAIKHERARLVQKMLDEKKAGAPTQDAPKKTTMLYNCSEHELQ